MRVWGPNHSGMCYTVGRENAAEHACPEAKSGNPTTGLLSGRQVTHLEEFGATFKPERKDNRMENLTTNYC